MIPVLSLNRVKTLLVSGVERVLSQQHYLKDILSDERLSTDLALEVKAHISSLHAGQSMCTALL